MEIIRAEVRPAPSGTDRVRLAARVAYATGETDAESYWFEVPAARADDLAEGGDPWLAALAPLAASTGEPLVSRLPADPSLLRGIRRALLTWKGWFPDLSAPRVAAPLADARPQAAEGRGACLFSGGIDSFFTLLRHRAGEPLIVHRIDDLLTVAGLDIPLARPAQVRRLAERTREIADATGTHALPMATNFRETRWSTTDWTRLAHGPLLAACGLALGARWDRVLIPSSLPYLRSQLPWGSHPLTDPMFSTTATEIVYDGASHLRTEKTARIAESELALRMLRVCWVEGAAGNCGRCAKCWRTLATLEAVGARERCSAFPPDSFSVEGLGDLRVSSGSEMRMLKRILPLAEAGDRHDLAQALRRAVEGSRHRLRVVEWIERLRELGAPDAPLRALRRAVLRGTVR